MSDKNFWNQYYQTHAIADTASPFATWVIENYEELGYLIELGCGNGRDSLFFAQNGLHVLGIDQCKDMVEILNVRKLSNAAFREGDFTQLDIHEKFDSVYSRFTLHSVRAEEASRTLNWAYDHLRPQGLLLVEVRGVNDELYGEGTPLETDAWFSDHYRRFIRLDAFLEELKEIGFEIDFSVETSGLAPYGDSDPEIIRVVARKK